jgi:hypothetical protein
MQLFTADIVHTKMTNAASPPTQLDFEVVYR